MNDARFFAFTLDAQMLKTTIKLTIAVNLHFCYLVYENVKQLILVEVVQLIQMACT